VDIQAYIASGKLELFVLGELSERERDEVIRLSREYPEIRKELEQIEEAFFEFDHQTGQKPSTAVKSRIFDSLEKDWSENEGEHEKVVPLSPWKSYFAAACFVALLASGLAVYFASQYFDLDKRFTALLQENSLISEDLNQYKVDFDQTNRQLETLLTGDYQRVSLIGEPFEIQKDAQVDVWWDVGATKVFVSVQSLNPLDAQFDYQLWAIGDQGPVGIGLINPYQTSSLQQMDAVAEAGTFAITIEPKGGSESPTLEKLVVIGNVS
jgi:anti-sigma-K factor RskA